MAKKPASRPSPRRKTARTDRARAAFLKVLAETCNVSEACRAAKIGRSTAYDWREGDPAFAAAWKDAEEEAIDSLERVAWDRAKIDKSDRMMEILLKAHRPEKYVERIRSELTGKDGGPVEYRNLSEEEINARLAALAEKHGHQHLAD
jgi:transposase